MQIKNYPIPAKMMCMIVIAFCSSILIAIISQDFVVRFYAAFVLVVSIVATADEILYID